MKKNRLLLGVGIGLVSVCTALAQGPRPNIVHIMVDDLGWQDIASHKLDGKPIYETPNLDRLTREGRRFTDAYAPSRFVRLRGFRFCVVSIRHTPVSTV